jgi:hypothetical protein
LHSDVASVEARAPRLIVNADEWRGQPTGWGFPITKSAALEKSQDSTLNFQWHGAVAVSYPSIYVASLVTFN